MINVDSSLDDSAPEPDPLPSGVGSLTSHVPGSLREIASLSMPLMISTLSASFMLFMDKIILARYSSEAMNAVVSIGMLVSLFQFGAAAITSIAEIFVGQHNGAKQYKQVGETVWQMLWFALFTSVAFVPLALFGGKLLIPANYYEIGLPYYQMMMGFCFIYPAYCALVAFYVGRGKMHLIMGLAIGANLINILLDFALIQGIPGVIQPLGVLGASIATLSAQAFQVVVLFYLFLKPKHREIYGTSSYRFRPKLFGKYIKIGLPNSLGTMIDGGAWAMSMHVLALTGPLYITVAVIGQTVYSLFYFANDSLQKAVMTCSSNFIGANITTKTPQLLKSALSMQWILSILLFFPLVVYPDPFIKCFVLPDLSLHEMGMIEDYLEQVLFWVWVYFVSDGAVWILAAILISGGDTKYTMIRSALNAWGFAFLPIYLFVANSYGSPVTPWQIFLMYSMINATCFYLRYRKGKWKNNLVDSQSTASMNLNSLL